MAAEAPKRSDWENKSTIYDITFPLKTSIITQ